MFLLGFRRVLGVGSSGCWNWWFKVLAVHALGVWGLRLRALRLWDAFGSGLTLRGFGGV